MNADYRETTGREATTFFCPILYRDERVELCKAHIINASFPDSDRTWTIQRADVDNRFGSILESDFVKLQHRGRHSGLDVFADPELARTLRPKFTLEGEEVEHFIPDGPVPEGFSPILVSGESGSVRLVLKLSPEETLAAMDKQWKVEIEADIRLHALGSLIKAAHLTLFHLLGYTYALSSGGHFVGRTILGDFFDRTAGAPKPEALEIARDHFAQFANLARPAPSPPKGLRGTISDSLLYLAMHEGGPWAIAVLVRTGGSLHAVLVPVFEEPERSARFLRFLEQPPDVFEVTLARFAGDHWDVSPSSTRFHWPEANLF